MTRLGSVIALIKDFPLHFPTIDSPEMQEWNSRVWGLSLGRVSEPSHSSEQNCSVCSLSLPESRRLHLPCPSSLLKIASRRQRNSLPPPLPPPAEPQGSAELLSVLSCSAKELRHCSLTSSPSFSWRCVRSVSSPCHRLAQPGLPAPLPNTGGDSGTRERGLGWQQGRFCHAGTVVCTLGCPSFLAGNLSAQMESAIRSFVSFPKHTTRFPACLTRCLCQAV